jgi:hypothetical protein
VRHAGAPVDAALVGVACDHGPHEARRHEGEQVGAPIGPDVAAGVRVVGPARRREEGLVEDHRHGAPLAGGR